MNQVTEPFETQAATEKGRRKQDRTTLALLAIAAFIAIGGIGFAIGRSTAPASTSTSNGNTNPFGGGRGGFPSFAPGQSFDPSQFGGNFRATASGVSGTVESVGPDSITVKLADGSTVTVSLTGTTTYHSETSASAGDVQAGTAVRIQVANGTAGQAPAPGSSASRTLTASDVLITGP